MSAAAFFARWRVRLGYPLAVVALWLARPSAKSILGGALIGAIGLGIRVRAAGYLHKQEVLTTTGPYAYTRNPLYLGSFFLIIGAAVAAHSWSSALILVCYFALFYSFVMRREERELYQRHHDAFTKYARTMPLFLPRLTPARLAPGATAAYAFAHYKKTRPFRAPIGFLFLLLFFPFISLSR